MLEKISGALKRRLILLQRKITRSDKYDYVAIVSIICYGIVFSYFTLLKNYNFNSYAADLGIFVQAIHTTLFNGRLFYYTPELWINPTGCYFGVHFSPILFLLLPVYAVYPSAESLLVAQSFLLAMGGIPLYLLSNRLLENKRLALGMVVLYLLYVPLQGANWFDFHQEAFIPIVVFFIYYFATTQSWKLYSVATMLGLTIEEHMVYIIFLLAIYFLVANHLRSTLNFIREKRSARHLFSEAFRNKRVAASVLTMIACLGWYIITQVVKGFFPINPMFIDVYQAAGNFQVLGFKGNIVTLPIYAVLNLQKVFNALSFDFYIKFLYILILFGPLLFISFRSKFCLVFLVVLIPMLLSNYLPYFTVGAQYPLFVIPLIFIATVDGLSTLGKQEHSKREALVLRETAHLHEDTVVNRANPRGSLMKMMVAISLVFVISMSPLGPLAYSFSQNGILWYPSYSSVTGVNYAQSLNALIGLIPSNASVLTLNNIFPHVASRLNAYLVPLDLGVYAQGEEEKFMESYVMQILNETEYVLLDSTTPSQWSNFVFGEMFNGSFGIYATTYQFVLFKKDYRGAPILVPNVNYQVYRAYKDFYIYSGQVIADRSSNSGLVAFSQKGVNNGTLIFGPYICLAPGTYNVTFEIKVSDQTEGRIATLDIADNYAAVILATRDLSSSDIPTTGWFNVTLNFSTSTFCPNLEFRVSTSGLANVYVDRVIVKVSG